MDPEDGLEYVMNCISDNCEASPGEAARREKTLPSASQEETDDYDTRGSEGRGTYVRRPARFLN